MGIDQLYLRPVYGGLGLLGGVQCSAQFSRDVDGEHLVALTGQVPVDLLEIGHRRLGCRGKFAVCLESLIEVVGIDLNAVLEGLVVHHHVTRQHRDPVLLHQVCGKVCRAIGNDSYGHVPLLRPV